MIWLQPILLWSLGFGAVQDRILTISWRFCFQAPAKEVVQNAKCQDNQISR